jgi:hypothetical protein
MDRFWDTVEQPYFWDALLDDPNPSLVVDIVTDLKAKALADPYRGDEYPDSIRILRSEPVVDENGRTCAYRMSYTVDDYVVPREGKSGLITFETAEAYDPGEVIDDPHRAKGNH